MDTPIGQLEIEVDEAGRLVLVSFHVEDRCPQRSGAAEGSGPPLSVVTRQLTEYFEGHRTTFDLPLAPRGTEFQRRVWDELTRIPYGETISYAELARRVGNPKAVRAVGAANGANPIPIIIPCHRVIGSSGTLTGYGGGLPRKQWLLALEQRATRLF